MGQGVPLETYKRGQLAEITGCNGETIRYYEKTGLLPAPTRGTNGYRYYDQDHLQCLGFIMNSKSLGFSNDNIRELLKISRGIGEHTRAEVKSLTENHLELVRQRIRDLKKSRKHSAKLHSSVMALKKAPTIARFCGCYLSKFNPLKFKSSMKLSTEKELREHC
jgi:MerR family mercuric resistance operon transcriptional regulator